VVHRLIGLAQGFPLTFSTPGFSNVGRSDVGLGDLRLPHIRAVVINGTTSPRQVALRNQAERDRDPQAGTRRRLNVSQEESFRRVMGPPSDR